MSACENLITEAEEIRSAIDHDVDAEAREGKPGRAYTIVDGELVQVGNDSDKAGGE